jgi:hypothetical protein
MARIPSHTVIKPELIEVGDKISVRHKENQGVTLTTEGVVHEIQVSGNIHYLRTEKGATIVAWAVGQPTGVVITLLSRPEHKQTSIEAVDSFIDKEMRERING